MFFDPISAWLVALIADGVVAGANGVSINVQTKYEYERVKQLNESLNNDIRRIKNQYGVTLAESAYNQIQLHIKFVKNSYPFNCSRGQIVIDLDNQDYIIVLLEECSRWYSNYSDEESQKKTKWYKEASLEARRRKQLYAKQLEETRMREAKEKAKDQTMSAIYVVVGLIIFVALIAFFFS